MIEGSHRLLRRRQIDTGHKAELDCASHCHFRFIISKGEFREDLYYCIAASSTIWRRFLAQQLLIAGTPLEQHLIHGIAVVY
jgi:hypothetical protein